MSGMEEDDGTGLPGIHLANAAQELLSLGLLSWEGADEAAAVVPVELRTALCTLTRNAEQAAGAPELSAESVDLILLSSELGCESVSLAAIVLDKHEHLPGVGVHGAIGVHRVRHLLRKSWG